MENKIKQTMSTLEIVFIQSIELKFTVFCFIYACYFKYNKLYIQNFEQKKELVE